MSIYERLIRSSSSDNGGMMSSLTKAATTLSEQNKVINKTTQGIFGSAISSWRGVEDPLSIGRTALHFVNRIFRVHLIYEEGTASPLLGRLDKALKTDELIGVGVSGLTVLSCVDAAIEAKQIESKIRATQKIKAEAENSKELLAPDYWENKITHLKDQKQDAVDRAISDGVYAVPTIAISAIEVAKATAPVWQILSSTAGVFCTAASLGFSIKGLRKVSKLHTSAAEQQKALSERNIKIPSDPEGENLLNKISELRQNNLRTQNNHNKLNLASYTLSILGATGFLAMATLLALSALGVSGLAFAATVTYGVSLSPYVLALGLGLGAMAISNRKLIAKKLHMMACALFRPFNKSRKEELKQQYKALKEQKHFTHIKTKELQETLRSTVQKAVNNESFRETLANRLGVLGLPGIQAKDLTDSDKVRDLLIEALTQKVSLRSEAQNELRAEAQNNRSAA